MKKDLRWIAISIGTASIALAGFLLTALSPLSLSAVASLLSGPLLLVVVLSFLRLPRPAGDSESASEPNFQEVLQNVKLLAVLVDTRGNVTFGNRHFLELTGWEAADVIGQDFFARFVPPEAREEARREFSAVFAAGVMQLPEVGEILTRAGERRLVSWAHTLVRDSQHRIAGNASVGRDITEERQLEGRRQQSQKLEAVGRLAGGVAHDFNNLLTIIMGYSDMTLLALPSSTLAENVREVKRAAERAAALTRQLLAFSRRQVLQPRVLDLNGVVADTDKMLRRLIGEDIDLRSVCDADLGRVKADRGQVEQVLLNLAVNARDAMPRGGRLTVETANVDLDLEYARTHAVVQPGPYVRLAVTDTGLGMDTRTMAQVFEPFFTTKREGKGTGLGLATVYGIVKQSGGYIWVYSEPGRGTTFKIYLPRVFEDAEPASAATPRAELRGTETVLLVEDDDGLRTMSAAALTQFGFHVMEAPSAEEALALVERSHVPIDIVLTDMVLPRMGGGDLAQELLVRQPSLKVVFMSGYAEQATFHQGLIGPDQVFLAKPFTPEVLVRKLRAVLDAA